MEDIEKIIEEYSEKIKTCINSGLSDDTLKMLIKSVFIAGMFEQKNDNESIKIYQLIETL